MPRYFLPLLILSLIACCIEVDISVPSFPSMGHYFNVNDGTIQMTIAYNFFGFCLGAALYGPLSDAYGRRPIMVWGNTLLLLGAIGCVIAPSIPFLLCARLIQGLGAAASAVVVFAMVADAYPTKDKAAKLIGAMNSVFTILMAAAPIAGGLINETAGWRGNYGIVALICLVSWVCLVFFLPETKCTFESFQFSKVRKSYGQLLTNIPFICASFVPSLSYAAYLSFITQAAFLYTETYELTLMMYVLHQSIIILVFSIASLLSGSIIQKLGRRGCVIKGVFLSGFGAMAMVAASLLAPKSPYIMTFFMSFVGLGSAISYPVIFSRSLELFPNIKGTASSAIMSMRAFICFAFVALTSYVYNGNSLRISSIVLSANIACLFFTIYLLRCNLFSGALPSQNAV